MKRRSAQAQNEAAQDFAVNAESTMTPADAPMVMASETASAVDAPATEDATQQDSGQTESEREAPRSEEPTAQHIVAESPSLEPVSPQSRWIAESVPVTAAEASLALDQEMEKAQQDEHVRAGSIGESAVVESGTVQSAVVEPPSVESAAGQVATESISDGDTSKVNSDRSSDSGSAVAEPHLDDAIAIAKAAFAAAASAGISTSGGEVTSNVPDIPDSELPRPSEAAAAWDNWQHIRDSVMSPQKAAAIAESAAIIVQANISAENGGASAAEQPILESAAIANIVDSVLAELKPKLMQEIAKKMAAEKK